MNIEDIKVGETYNVRVKVVKKETARVCCHTISKNGNCFSDFHSWFSKAETAAFSPITPETDPKYDPCRLFKKGDIVEPVERWGRKLRIKAGQYRITKEEEDNRVMITHCETGFSYAAIDTVYLNLVTPVGELEPYSVGGCIDGCVLYKNGEFYAEFVNSSDAEQACKLLNAEYRKENSHE